MAHGHQHKQQYGREPWNDAAGAPRPLAVAVAVLAVLTTVGLVALYPRDPIAPAQEGFAQGEEVVPGRIERLEQLPTADDGTGFLPPGAVEVRAVVRLEDGSLVTIDAVDETGLFEEGLPVEVAVITAEGQPVQYGIVDVPRGRPLLVLAVLFVAAVVAFGRLQGVRALVGLAASAVVIVGWLVPSLLGERDPVLVAVVGATAIMLVTLPLAHGLSAKMMAAAVGTASALLLTAGLAWAFVAAARVTGLAEEEAQFVLFATGRPIDLRGLLLAGIILGGLGVLDDVTISQASTAFELRRADPGAPTRAVYAAAVRVGRDHVAATVNTLVLAYAGAALPLLLLFSIGGEPLGSLLTSELVAIEIVRTLVGSIGLVAAVPLTTALAAAAAPRTGPAPGTPEGLDGLDGHRTASPAEDQDGEPAPATLVLAAEEHDATWESRLRAAYRLDEERRP